MSKSPLLAHHAVRMVVLAVTFLVLGILDGARPLLTTAATDCPADDPGTERFEELEVIGEDGLIRPEWRECYYVTLSIRAYVQSTAGDGLYVPLAGLAIQVTPPQGNATIDGITGDDGRLHLLLPAAGIAIVAGTPPPGYRLIRTTSGVASGGVVATNAGPVHPVPVSVDLGERATVDLYYDLPPTTLSVSVDRAATQIVASIIPIRSISKTVILGSSFNEGVPSAPISSIDMAGSPFSSIPISSIPISSIPISSIPISYIPISSISWEELLAGTPLQDTPTQLVTLNDILALPEGQEILGQVRIGNLDLLATALQNTSLAELTLGGAPISSIDVTPELCQQFEDPGQACADPGSSVMALEFAGVGIASAPISSIPISSIPISSIPISSIPISSIPISSISAHKGTLAGIPISSIDADTGPLCADALVTIGMNCATASLYDLLAAYLAFYANDPAGLAGSPISSIPISSIPISSIPISSIPISSIPISSITTDAATYQAIPISSITADTTALCQDAATRFGIDCATASLHDLLAAYAAIGDLSASPFSSIPISSIPISSIPISSIPISSIPISSIPISSIPISSIPISSIELQQSALDATPISSITADTTALCQDAATRFGIDCATASLYDLLVAYAAIMDLAASPFSSIPISSIPISSIGPDGAPISSIDFDAIPISSIPISSIAVDGTPISSIPISSIPISSIPFSSIPISSIPISSIPISSIQLTPAALGSIPFSSIPISSIAFNSIPINSIPISSIEIAGTPISSIQLDQITPGGKAPCGSEGWVETTEFTCGGLGLNANSTLIALVLALRNEEVTAANNPLAAVPISSIPFSSIDLTQVPLSSINLGAIPISSIPISSIGSVTIRGVPISSIPIVNGPSDLSSLVTCTNCATLGDAIQQGGVVKGTTVGDVAEIFGGEVNVTLNFFFGSGKALGDVVDELGDATLADLIEVPPGNFNGTTVQDLLTALGATPDQVELFLSFFFGDLTIGELYAEGGTLGTLTLGQLLVAILDQDDYPWEELPFAELAPSDLVASPERVSYQLSINTSLTAPADLTVTLPEQFRYVPGSARFGTAPVEPAGTGRNLRWDNLPGQAGQSTLSFDAYPGFRTGSTTIAASVWIGGQTAHTNGAPLVVEEAFEANDTVAQATAAEADVLYLGHIADPDDVDYFKIEAPPGGARVGYYLSHLSGDVDMVLVKPAPVAQRAAAPPLGNGIATDGQAGGIEATGAIPPDPPQQAGGQGFLTVASAQQAGDAGETIVEEAATNETYYLKVTAHTGNVSNDAYALRIKFLSPLATPECAPIQFVHAGEGVTATQALPAGNITSLFIVNQKRLGDAFGQGRATMAVNALKQLVASPHLPGGAVLFVDQVAEYSAWDQNPCDPEAANAVVHAINALVDQVGAQSTAELENIVLVGSDEMVPFFRAPDPTLRWNERSYAAGLEGTDSGTWGALSTEHILTDAVYGDFDPIPWLDRYLYVPDIGIGRLVETPEEIKLQADLFIASQGKLDRQKGVSAGYDFLADGAREVAANLLGAGLGSVKELINNTWSRAELLQLVKAEPAYDVLSLNAHFDHSRLLPADQDKVVGQQELVETADFAGAPLRGQIIFTMGCHAGLSMAGYLGTSIPNIVTTDWAQTLAGGGAIFVANTGYGYGDTATVALSERLMALYAERLDGTVEAGRALALAQQAYMARLGLYGVYDEKVLMQTTFYGLPMYRVGDATPQVAAAEPLPTTSGPATGLSIAEVSVSLAFPEEDKVQRTDRGDIWKALPERSTYRSLIEDGPAVPVLDAGTEEAHDRPIQPRVAIDVTQSTLTAHGAVIELIEAGEDISSFDPVFHRPVISTAALEPELSATDGNFPGRFQNVTSYLAADGPRQNLVLIPGQFFFDGAGTGVQRLFDRVDATVYYHASSKDFIQPEVTRTLAEIKGGAAEFSVAVRDRTQEDGLDDYSGTVVRVVVLIAGADGRWTPLDLQRDESSGLWSGRQLMPEGTEEVAYFVQAVDSSGNVGVETNKGAYFEAVESPAQPPRADLAIDISGTLVANSEANYAGGVTIAITGGEGLVLSYRLDDGVAAAYEGPFEVGSAGYHTVEAFASNGSSVTRSFFIEREDPAARRIRVTVPRAGRSYHLFQVEGARADFTCIDVGSGIEECGGDLPAGFPIPTDTVGMETLRFYLVDGNGERFTQAVSYIVGEPCRLLPTIVAKEGVPVEGTAGNDVIWGTTGPDIIRGNGGNDIICSGAGDDVIETGAGNDYVDAGPGHDTIVDEGGHNLIRAGIGNDTIATSAGDDYIDGGTGDDRISGGPGNDTIDGGSGFDILDGGAGFDECVASRDGDTTAECEIVRPSG